MFDKFSSRGDTIIEVMLAVTIFSMVAVGALTIMNQGMSVAQRSLEITLARQQVDGQVEMLRYIHSRAQENVAPYTTTWNSIKTMANSLANPKQLLNADTCPIARTGPNGMNNQTFALNDSASIITTFGPITTYSKITGNTAEGIYIQVKKVTDGGISRAYDAYVQACWNTPGSSKPVTIGTIVRLYDANA